MWHSGGPHAGSACWAEDVVPAVNGSVPCREGWQLSMQRTLGVEGVSPEARRLYFDPGTMFSSASRLHQMLGGLLHVLEVGGGQEEVCLRSD